MTELKPATAAESDAALSQVFALHAAFKDSRIRRIACVIVQEARRCNGAGVFPDAPAIVAAVEALGADDKNVVGCAWRWLGKTKILTRGQQRRKSTAANSHGREIACWHVGNIALAETFLNRNDAAHQPPQRELFNT